MNWKLRIKNKATLAALIAAGVPFIYIVLMLLGITPSITEDALISALMLILDALTILGILVDPTTSGVTDSELAMGYEAPREDTK